MKIQQHDDVVVDAAVTAAGLRRSSARGRGVAGEREAPRVKGAAGVGQGGRTSPLWAGSPPHFSPWGPPGWVAPPGGPPGPFRWSRYNTGDPRNSPDGRNCTSYI